MAGQNPFPVGTNIAAPGPSDLWDASFTAPFPTNAPWQNFVLNKGMCPEVVHPYLVRTVMDSDGGGAVVVSYPGHNPTQNSNDSPAFFVPDIAVSSVGGLGCHRVVAYDDLSVTLEWAEVLTVPLVRGSPYVTCVCEGITLAISTTHKLLDVVSNEDDTKHALHFSNGQTWILYTSSSLPLGSDLTADGTFSGVLRVALLPCPEDEDLLDFHSACYPIGGTADFSVPYQVSYEWETVSWLEGGGEELMMLSLPIHRQILVDPLESTGKLGYHTLDGHMEGISGSKWVLKEPGELAIGWQTLRGALRPGAESAQELADSLQSDVANLQPIQSASPYGAGKLLARAARLVLISEELGMEEEQEVAVEVLRSGITAWLNGTLERNGLVYDEKWGGIVSQQGAQDASADSGNGLYNDHHYQWGYFLYAGAVLAKMDAAWAEMYKGHLYALMYDIANPGDSPLFPRLRHFDPWVLHSWASGLVETAEARSQESTSKAVNVFYSVSLLGLAYDDEALVSFGCTLTALECRAVRTLRHIPSSSNLYEAVFAKEKKGGNTPAGGNQDWFGGYSGPCRRDVPASPSIEIETPAGVAATPTRVTTVGVLLLAKAASESFAASAHEQEPEQTGSASQLSITFNEARKNRTRGDLKHLPSMEVAIKQGVQGRSYAGNVIYDRNGRRVVRPRPASGRVASANWLGPDEKAPPSWKRLFCLAA